ncbi:MAG: hypothetical protein EAZ30_05130 [Betaproteobacteria bacterium]|nr:MAG: hypothetical protein EAZ30_05130 [Betaproteobacteria bacterium]
MASSAMRLYVYTFYVYTYACQANSLQIRNKPAKRTQAFIHRTELVSAFHGLEGTRMRFASPVVATVTNANKESVTE